MDIGGRIAQANGPLKANCVRVTIQQIGDKLHLQATLPYSLKQSVPKEESSFIA